MNYSDRGNQSHNKGSLYHISNSAKTKATSRASPRRSVPSWETSNLQRELRKEESMHARTQRR
jgi:hypothetical protein